MDIWQQVLDFEPFLRLLGIKAELLGPDDVVLRLPVRQEIANHLGGLHGGAQFTLGESTALAAAVISLGKQLDQVAVLTRGATISYQKTALGELAAHARRTREPPEHVEHHKTRAIERPGRDYRFNGSDRHRAQRRVPRIATLISSSPLKCMRSHLLAFGQQDPFAEWHV
jgi:uncharacterized protein (TIGR00369 family)